MSDNFTNDLFTIDFDNSHYVMFETYRDWCYKKFGHGSWGHRVYGNNIWSCDTFFGKTAFYFKYEKDLLWFTLVWL